MLDKKLDINNMAQTAVNEKESLSETVWLELLNRFQQQTIDANNAYQKTLLESHLAFLKTSETVLSQLMKMRKVNGELQPPVQIEIKQPQVDAIPVSTPLPQTILSPTQPINNLPETRLSSAAVLTIATVATTQPVATEPQAQPSDKPIADSIKNLVLGTIANKTGYPVDMLTLEMSLEADLGIDSIKRVEIFSTIQEQLPNLPQVDAAHYASLRTLGEIATFISEQTSTTVSIQHNAQLGLEATQSPVQVQSETLAEVQTKLLEIVAEKTGYPIDMLTVDMSLESDLGIDSIKRVEIMATLQERLSKMPEVDSGQLGSLQTLREIAVFITQMLVAGETTQKK